MDVRRTNIYDSLNRKGGRAIVSKSDQSLYSRKKTCGEKDHFTREFVCMEKRGSLGG